MKRQTLRMFLEFVIGILLSFIINGLIITCAFFYVHANNLNYYNLNLLGMNICKIINYHGTYNTNNLMIIGIILSILSVIIGEIIFELKGRKKNTQL